MLRLLARGVELTDAGRLLLEQARVILKQIEDAAVGVRRRVRGETGRVIIGASGSFFHPVLMKILRACKSRYPQVVLALEVEVTNISLLIAWLETGRIDRASSLCRSRTVEVSTSSRLIDEDCVVALPSEHAKSGSSR